MPHLLNEEIGEVVTSDGEDRKVPPLDDEGGLRKRSIQHVSSFFEDTETAVSPS